MSFNFNSLSGFKAFESAARHLSFTHAGEELFITQAAVSQQIKHLEGQLGFKLFYRMTRKLALTEDGERLAAVVTKSLSDIKDCIEDILLEETNGSITISTIPSLAMRWIIPRLGNFRKIHPNIQLKIHADERMVDFKAYNIDLAIRYGTGNYPNFHVTQMMREEIFPVCSPKLLKGDKPLKNIEDIYHHELLVDEVQRVLGDKTDWSIWLDAVGILDIDTRKGTSFSNSIMAIQAATEGQGLAICRTSLVADDLKAGRLVKPFETKVKSKNAYYFVCLKEKADKPRIKAVIDWLMTEKGNDKAVREAEKNISKN
ncbi:MAG: transcriptional regulator GcvA [Deltaproteobacteria bacterium]|jgi:LysR family transcriptional regulator, glycine cleavage system transcriptional activator|nr:transcriptional regulator GcvA [Deltaproteobacteria bacterium]MBT4527267.1 transcriptional regulator GcvA [Deltaproteobacteria bacterium]